MTDDVNDLLDADPFTSDSSENSTSSDTSPQSSDNANTSGATDTGSVDTGTDEIPTVSPDETTNIDSPGIGHVLASDQIRISRQGHNLSVFVVPDQRETIEVGDYVQIPYPDGDTHLFAAIDGLRYEPYSDIDDRNESYNLIESGSKIDESEFVQVAELDPRAILDSTGDDVTRHIVNRVPKPNTTAELSRDDAYLRTGLNIPRDGLFAGYLSVGGGPMTVDGQKFPYYIPNPGIDPETGGVEDGEPAMFRHTLVAGSTGTGKTHFTKNLLRQLADTKRYPVEINIDDAPDQAQAGITIFDPENEYGELRDKNTLLDIEDELRQHGIAFGGIDDLEIFVPEVNRTRSPDTGPSRELSIPFSIVQNEPQLLMPFDDMSDVTRGAIVSCISAYFNAFGSESPWETRSVSEPTYDDFITFLNTHDHDGSQLRNDSDITSRTWSAVMRRVKRSEYNAVFDAGGTPFTEVTDAMFRPGRVTVIPTSHIRGKKEELVVLSLLSYIIENKLTDYGVDSAVKGTPLLVALDEAHTFLSEPSNTREQYIVSKARQAAKQGRKELLGLLAITQNPDDIDDEILKQINTNIFLQLRREVVRDVPSVPREFTDEIPKFAKGQAVVKAPDVEAVEVRGLPQCVTRHDS